MVLIDVVVVVVAVVVLFLVVVVLNQYTSRFVCVCVLTQKDLKRNAKFVDTLRTSIWELYRIIIPFVVAVNFL